MSLQGWSTAPIAASASVWPTICRAIVDVVAVDPQRREAERERGELRCAPEMPEPARRLVETGVAPPLDFTRAEVDLLEREVELKRIRQELERLGAADR